MLPCAGLFALRPLSWGGAHQAAAGAVTVRYGLRLADVFHGFGHGDARLFADMEKTVDCRTRCEYDGRVREYFDPLGAELLQGDAFYADEGPVGDFHVVFLGQFVERGLFDDSGPRLRN